MRPSLALAALLLLGACSFDLDRGLAAGELRGRVVMVETAGPQAVAGAIVRLEGSSITVKTDAAGRFVIRGLPAGNYALRLTSGTELGLRLRGIPLVDSTDLGTLTLGVRGRLEGTITRGGVPEDARLVLDGVAETRSVDGAWSFPGLLPGSYELFVFDAAGHPAPVPTVAVKAKESTRVAVALEALTVATRATLTGSARLADALDHAGILVFLDRPEPITATTDAHGLYLAADVPAGAYTIRVHKEGFRSTAFGPVVLTDDSTLPDIVLLEGGAGCGSDANDGDDDGDGTPDADEPAACRCTPGTTDLDEDGRCDDLDRDHDGDDVDDVLDNCPLAWNADQHDRDEDGIGDVCDEVDLCAGQSLDCSGFDASCHVGVCDPLTGECTSIRSDNGTECNDGNGCTLDDECRAGVCIGDVLDCSELTNACGDGGGTCNPASGLCELPTACDDTDPCTWSDDCGENGCLGLRTLCGPRLAGTGEAAPSAFIGGGTVDFHDACPPGQLPVGAEARLNDGSVLIEYTTLCGIPTTVGDESGPRLELLDGARVPETGGHGNAGVGGPILVARCAVNEVVVGFDSTLSTAPAGLTGLAFHCAPLVVSGDGFESYAVALEATASTRPLLGAVSASPVTTLCPAGEIATGIFGRASNALEAYGLNCAAPVFEAFTTAPMIGAPGGSRFVADCPAGEVPVSVEGGIAFGFWEGILGQFVIHCTRVGRIADGPGYVAFLMEGARLPSTGAYGTSDALGDVTTLSCPTGSVAVGYASAVAQTSTGGLALRCAVPTWNAAAEVTLGPITPAPGIGDVSIVQDCPPGFVVAGFAVNSGEIVDGLSLRCAKFPSVPELIPD